ncbi:MAG: S-methyl-5'-thioadenosine phosphorylase [Candidatus Hydrogenedentota bacterium]|nr:MAG: S-methyl-5'-thioadenosine phosphorylase [Candidatus Hydrogenedentota bacterium]
MIGIIGGTGLYGLEGFTLEKEEHPETPWGKASDPIRLGTIETEKGKVKLAFLSRHGAGHRILPSEIPQKANLASLKMLGVKRIIAFSAVGSLKEEIAPGHFAVPNQIIDRTRHREDTFFGDGVVAHVSFGDPFCPDLNHVSVNAISKCNIPCHEKETLVCMEGPAFSTRAESKLYKSWGAGLINMSVLPEAKLARELEICYQMICMSTDYDSWRESEEAVTAEEIMKIVKQNSENAIKVLQAMLPHLAEIQEKECSCHHALQFSIITAPEKRKQETVQKLHTVLPKYF